MKAFHTTDGSGQMVTSLGVATIRNVSFAQLEWFGEHQERHNLYPALVEVWSNSSGRSTFVPLASIVCYTCRSGKRLWHTLAFRSTRNYTFGY